MPKVKIIEPGEIVTPPTPLPVPSPTYETEGGERYTAQGEVITAPRNRYTGDTHAEIPEYEGSYFVTENGTIPCGGYEMISDLVVNVEPKGLTQITITENGTYKPEDYDGYSQVVVAIPTYDGSYSVTENATLPTKNKLMTDDLVVNVPVGGNTLKTLLDATGSTYYLFRNYAGNAVADLIKYDDTAEVTNASYMFYSSTSITSVPLLNTSKVTNMSSMFYNCGSLTSVPLFNTSSVGSMAQMFSGCSKLTSVPLFDTSNVSNMSNMFYSCVKLASVPLFDTSKVTNMTQIFAYCYALTSIPALDAREVTDFTNAFLSCDALTEIHMFGMKRSFNISYSTLFTREALVEIITNVADLTGQTARTLTMGATNMAKLTQADIDALTAKNWTLA